MTHLWYVGTGLVALFAFVVVGVLMDRYEWVRGTVVVGWLAYALGWLIHRLMG